MLETRLSKTKKNLILSYFENVLKFDKESQLPEQEYYSLFEENMYRLVSFIGISNDVTFKKSLFDKIRKGKLSAKQVFLIGNIEQRRVAYELMDKIKMKQLKGKIIDEVKDDGYGYPMKLIAFLSNLPEHHAASC